MGALFPMEARSVVTSTLRIEGGLLRMETEGMGDAADSLPPALPGTSVLFLPTFTPPLDYVLMHPVEPPLRFGR